MGVASQTNVLKKNGLQFTVIYNLKKMDFNKWITFGVTKM